MKKNTSSMQQNIYVTIFFSLSQTQFMSTSVNNYSADFALPFATRAKGDCLKVDCQNRPLGSTT